MLKHKSIWVENVTVTDPESKLTSSPFLDSSGMLDFFQIWHFAQGAWTMGK